MKLELKHLAGYLPYRLKIRYIERNETHDLEYHNIMSICSEQNHLKPILRPLSDLTKEIEEDFNVYTTLSLRSKNDYDSGNPLILKWSYEDIQKLLELHFDIYGLIEKGLAIDINTL